MMMIKRKHFFTLLETLIAMALTVVVLTTLTYFYRQIDQLNTQAEAIQAESFKMRYVENRFATIFPQAVSETDKAKDFFFFTISDPGGIFARGSPISLVFTFNNGVDLNKLFSQHILGRIYLDTNGRLCMATWPSPNRWVEGAKIPMELEVLLENVDAMKFWFFIAPDKKWQLQSQNENDNNAPTTPGAQQNNPPGQNPAQNPQAQNPANPQQPVTVVTVKPSPEGGWINEWSQDYQQLPAIIKIEVTRNGKTEYFSFPCSKCKRQPTYNQ